MRHLLILGLTILLTNCASSTTNYYTQTVQSWHGGNTNTLFKLWGAPNNSTMGPNGDTLSVYTTQNYSNYKPPTPATIGVSVSKEGRPTLTSEQPMRIDQTTMALTCSAVFESDKYGKIVKTETRGNGCFANQQFVERYANPTAKIVAQ